MAGVRGRAAGGRSVLAELPQDGLGEYLPLGAVGNPPAGDQEQGVEELVVGHRPRVAVRLEGREQFFQQLLLDLAEVGGDDGPEARVVGLLDLQAQAAPGERGGQVAIIRTGHGVAHIRAENMRAAGYVLAWLQAEDYGPRTGTRLLATRGQAARTAGRASLDADFDEIRSRNRAIETYHLLDQETRDMYDGFAAGINRYVELHRTDTRGMPTDFAGYDVASLHRRHPPTARIRRFCRYERRRVDCRGRGDDGDTEALQRTARTLGTCADARHPGARFCCAPAPRLDVRLLRSALTVTGVMDFYGDFRIGGPLGVIGGFNKDLGWATTNSNTNDRAEIYAVALDPNRKDYYLLDGASVPLKKETITVEFKDGDRISSETRDFWSMPLGPVIHRTADKVFIVRMAGDNEYRAGEQFLRMMRAKSLAEFKDAMKIRALVSQNYTYADRAGNIYHLWNGSMPPLPHDPGGEAATPITRTADAWTRLIPFEDLPQWLNPRAAHIQNENDPPHFTNVSGPINLTNKPRTSSRRCCGCAVNSRSSSSAARRRSASRASSA